MSSAKYSWARIAYLGPEKTNAHKAAITYFGKAKRFIHAPTIDDVFHLVERRVADYGVVPVENSLGGVVTHTLDRFVGFLDTPVKIQGEIQLPIKHYIIYPRKYKLKDIKKVFSHPQAIAQCRRWLDQHMPYAVRQDMNSTAYAAFVAFHQTRFPAAVIGRKELAWGHKARAKLIAQDGENRTRFLILGLEDEFGRSRQIRTSRRHLKTSVLFILKDKPGALHDALIPFKQNRINLTKIESLPSKKRAWEYLFFIDAEGHESSKGMSRALRALKSRTTYFKVLGSYPVSSRK